MLPITKEKAVEILKSFNPENSELVHYLSSGCIMKQVAKHLNEDENYFELLGLLHDVDWTLTKNNPEEHISLAPKILRENGFDEEFISIIVSHVYGYDEIPKYKNELRTKPIEHILAASETLTGIIYAYALMRGKKISDMEVSGLKKKFKDKKFAENCKREIILEIEKGNIPIDEFFKIGIEGMKSIKEEIGLD